MNKHGGLYMAEGALLTVISVMAYSAYNSPTKVTPLKEKNIVQIKELSDTDGKSGLDTIILEDGRTIQIEEKDNKLYISEK